jgi:lipoprotein-releasing system permease protein
MSGNLTWQIMIRYLRGKRTANAVPLLSRISMTAIAVAACAMIILLSVFNGLGLLIKDLYTAFYPDVRIVAKKGKFFALDEQQLQQIKRVNGIGLLTATIEDNVLMNNEGRDNQVITVKGIDKDFFTVNELKPYIVKGTPALYAQGQPGAIVGSVIMAQMGMVLDQGMNSITLYYPNAENTNPGLDAGSAFNSLLLRPTGMFAVMGEYDSKYILAPFPLVQELLQAGNEYSAIEIKLTAGANPDEVKKQVQQITGAGYSVETRYEQNRTVYTIINTEKWAMYAILVLVLIIASFNMIGALSLLVLEKQKDIAILKAMGADKRTIRNIFIGEGILWALTGGIIGIIPGLLICWGQSRFQWIKMSGFIIDAYPVHIIFTDVLLIMSTTILVGLLAALYPASRAVKVETGGLRS